MIDWVRFAAVVVGAVFQTFFVFRLCLRPWWRHFVGRALFVKSSAVLLLLVTQVLVWVFPADGMEVASAVVLWLVAGSIMWQATALERQIRSERKVV